MRWKLIRRRLSVSAPRMIVRSRLPWPVRWAALAVMLGFSAAIALWAFEFGKSIAGLDRDAKLELVSLRDEVARLRDSHVQAQRVADTAESLLKAERTAQERLAVQVRQLEADKQALQADLAFFERLMPASAETLQVRGMEVRAASTEQLGYKLLLAQNGKQTGEFKGRYDLVLTGLLDGQPWTAASSAQAVTFKQVARLEGMVAHPAAAVIKTVQVRVMDAAGALQATRTLKP
jgi:hypothetical protein